MTHTTRPLILLCTLLLSTLAVAQIKPDFAAARDEAVQILAGLIRIDTSNPPGNETKAAQYLKTILDKQGIRSEIHELERGRGNLVTRLKGSGRKQPILLMGHIDVVGVERDKWTVDPFAGVIKDGYIYGRGASDDKGMTAVAFTVLLYLHRLKVPLDRDVIFLAEAGEESSPRVGIEYMVEKHWDKIAAEFALNEGGTIHQVNGKVQYVGVSPTEKVPRRMRLVARGSSGHGSVPRVDNAIVHLAAATAAIGQWLPPMRLNDITREFFRRVAEISPPEEADLYRNINNVARRDEIQQKLRTVKPSYSSMLRTSISPTIIRGGFRNNVIPTEAEAVLDIRILPDEDIPSVMEQMRQVINDPAVEIVPPQPGGRPIAPPSRLDTEMFRALERSQQRVFPGVPTIPMMLTGATDSAQLRAKGVQAYGIGPVRSDDDARRVHGNDERLSIDGLGKFLEYMWWAVTEVAAAK
jgi:acetylornithine deacetylase/succinyl-diaminopimelate desuccinylase-like protein